MRRKRIDYTFDSKTAAEKRINVEPFSRLDQAFLCSELANCSERRKAKAPGIFSGLTFKIARS